MWPWRFGVGVAIGEIGQLCVDILLCYCKFLGEYEAEFNHARTKLLEQYLRLWLKDESSD